jgi:hypothetical protein
MNTTNLFVELIVIGVGASIWVCLLILSVFGYGWVPFDKVFSLPLLIPALSIVYLLGIVTDRIADAIFEAWWGQRYRKAVYKNSLKQFFEDRRTVFSKSEQIARLYEYSRSRMRICRSWAVNAILIALTLNLFLWIRMRGNAFFLTLSLFGTGMVLLLAGLSFFAWQRLKRSEAIKLKEAAEFLRKAPSIKPAAPA